MKSKMFLVGLLIVLTLSLCACPATTNGEEEESTVDPSSYAAATFVEFYTCNVFAENSHVTDNIEMRTNKTLTIILCSNPSTGFEWGEEAQISDPTVMELASYELVAPVSKEPGAAGTEKYIFNTLKAGTCTISFEYGRPWEGGEKAEWTCTLNVTVK